MNLLMLPIFLMLNSSQSPSIAQEAVDGSGIDISVVSMDEAKTLFDKYVHMDLNWNIPEYGCQARAAVFAYEMDKNNSIKLGKAMMTTSDTLQSYFFAPTKEDGKLCFKWSFHVAPIVRVLAGNKIEDYVLDPTLFKGPELLSKWRDYSQAEHSNETVRIKTYSRFKSIPLKTDREKTSWEDIDIPGALKFLSNQKMSRAESHPNSFRVKCKIN